jgi:hypothetical protein
VYDVLGSGGIAPHIIKTIKNVADNAIDVNLMAEPLLKAEAQS